MKTYIRTIWKIITDAEDYILAKYPEILLPGHPTVNFRLPKEIKFVTAQQLHDEFPDASIHERENAAVEKYGAIFILGMGWPMSDGSPAEEQRSPSYDDWDLNVSNDKFWMALLLCLQIKMTGRIVLKALCVLCHPVVPIGRYHGTPSVRSAFPPHIVTAH